MDKTILEKAKKSTRKPSAKRAKNVKEDALTVVDDAVALPTAFMNKVVQGACNDALEELEPLGQELQIELKNQIVDSVKGGVEQYRNFFAQTLKLTTDQACMLLPEAKEDDQEIIDVSATSV